MPLGDTPWGRRRRRSNPGPGRPIRADVEPKRDAHRPRLGELLIAAGVIDEAQLRSALGEQAQWGRPLGATLVQMGFVDEETLVRTLARQLSVPVVWLRGRTVRSDVLALVPREVAEKHRCLPVLLDERGARTLLLAMADPADLAGADEVSFHTGLPVKPVLAAPSELDDAIERHYPREDGGAGDGNPFDAPRFVGVDPEESPPELLGAPHQPDAAGHAEPGAAPPRVVSVEVEAILRALTQLLVEKGVITRDELVDRVRDLGKGGAAT